MLNLDGEEIPELVEDAKPDGPKITPFTFVEAITYTKDDTLFAEWAKQYNTFIINKALSFHSDTVVQTNEMNKYPSLDKDMQFTFLAAMIRKRKRYGGWIKKVEADKLDTIKEFYKYSTARAMNVADLITDADLSVMKQRMSKGGVNARSVSEKSTGRVRSG